MKRDMDLIRKMLIAVEESPRGYADTITVDGYTDDQIGYHGYLAVQAGLAEGADVTAMGASGPNWMLLNLTWEGHEFLDAARDDSRWRAAMEKIGKSAGSVPVPVLVQLLAALAKQSLGLS